ncbi:hypothetical protein ACLBWT_01280 [Paenibacillus sp. D51F]
MQDEDENKNRIARPPGIEAPFPLPEEAFMTVELLAGTLGGIAGIVRYPAAFGSVIGWTRGKSTNLRRNRE